VIVIDEGNSARQILGDPNAAARTVVVGIVDYVERHGTVEYDHRRTQRGAPAASGAEEKS
jgi:hypothetical protein